MSDVNVAANVAFMTKLADGIEGYKTLLTTEKSYDPTADIARLRALVAILSPLDAKQEKAKADLKNLTDEVEAASDTQYVEASSILDVVMGKLGKSSAEAKSLQKLRTEARGSSKSQTAAAAAKASAAGTK